MDAIFSQASLPKPVWNVAVKVMDFLENTKLKDLATLTTKPQFKQQYLAPWMKLIRLERKIRGQMRCIIILPIDNITIKQLGM